MTSLFTAFVAQGLQVPEIDPRIASHVEICEVVSDEERPAASVDGSTEAIAPEMASIELYERAAVEGTRTPT